MAFITAQMEVEAQKGTAALANTAAAMGVASMVVGQYNSRVFSRITHIKKIAEFQAELLENNEWGF